MDLLTQPYSFPRRKLLRGGLAGFAAAMMAPALSACDNPPPAMDAGTDAGSPVDGGPPPPVDGGPTEFPARTLPDPPMLESLLEDIGPLSDTPDANGILLPAGFTSRVIGHSMSPVETTGYNWHIAPDGGATFLTEDGGWIYVSNSETLVNGGTGAVRFDMDGAITAAYRILEGTSLNCAGGRTPWHTWLSCEEMNTGRVWECDPWGEHPTILRPALGVFKHEAVAVDHDLGHLYLTEDDPEGAFYRFIPDGVNSLGNPNLSAGTLQVAEVAPTGEVTWHDLPDPQFEGGTPTREQIATSTVFDGGEGVWYHNGIVYFSTKGDNRIWAYETATESLSVLYDDDDHDPVPLRGVDNITVSCCGDVLVAEDGGSMQVVAILPSGTIKPLLRVTGQDISEITGPAFSPDGTRLYFSSQRGTDGLGFTYEITGPYHLRLPAP